MISRSQVFPVAVLRFGEFTDLNWDETFPIRRMRYDRSKSGVSALAPGFLTSTTKGFCLVALYTSNSKLGAQSGAIPYLLQCKDLLASLTPCASFWFACSRLLDIEREVVFHGG